MAEMADDYDSVNAKGEDINHYDGHNCLKVLGVCVNNMSDEEKAIHASTLMPEAMRHVAGLYKLFWETTHPPKITSVNPNTLPGLPLSQTQELIIIGSDFLPTSTLTFYDGATTYSNKVPIYINPTELKYNIAVGTNAANWTVTVVNPVNSSAVFPFTVSVAPRITVTLPNGGEFWQQGTQHSITWNGSGSVGSNVKIELYKGGSLNQTITSGTSNDGSYLWTVPSTQTPGTDYKLKITSASNLSYNDFSDNYFSITSTQTTFTLNLSATNGTVNKNPNSASYAPGRQVILTPIPNTGYAFSRWSGDSNGSANPLTLTMNSNKNITANFTATSTQTGWIRVSILPQTASDAGAQWRLTSESTWRNSGTIKSVVPFGTYQVEFKAIPWWITPPNKSVDNPGIYINSDPYIQQAQVLTVNKSGNGMVTSSPSGISCGTDCSQSYTSGTPVILTQKPASGWSFSGWGGACSGKGSCTVSMMSSKSVTATFTQDQVIYTLSVSTSGSGTVKSSPSGISCGSECSESYTIGTPVALTANPASGWRFSRWSGCSDISSPICYVTMNYSRDVAATFIQNSTADSCVGNASELQAALYAAETNSKNDIIKVVQGGYT